jgi:hypothetical protein
MRSTLLSAIELAKPGLRALYTEVQKTDAKLKCERKIVVQKPHLSDENFTNATQTEGVCQDENCCGGLRVESTDTKSESEDAFPERWDFVVDFPS